MKKLPEGIFVHTNHFMLDDEDKPLGVFVYDEYIYADDVRPSDRAKTFKVRLAISDGTYHRPLNAEIVEFIATFELQRYIQITKLPQHLSGECIRSFDFRALLFDFVDQSEIDYRLERLRKKGSMQDMVIMPCDKVKGLREADLRKEYKHIKREHEMLQVKTGDEFLTLAGNYTIEGIDDKEFAHVVLSDKSADPKEVSPAGALWLDDEYQQEKWSQLKTREERFEFLKNAFTCDESILYFGDYSIRVGGNDDCSYTKTFIHKYELDAEIKYLRNMQPIDIELDIVKRGYTFTN